MSEQKDRAVAALRRHRLDAVLLVTPPNVTYASGFESPLPGGFATEVIDWLPPCAVLRADGTGTLVVPDDEVARAEAESWLDVVSFESLRHFEPTDPERTWVEAVRGALDGAELVGLEPTAPAAVAAGLRAVDATAPLREARSVKTGRELDLLARAAAAADAAQHRLLELAAEPGATEVELWTEIASAFQRAAGGSVPVVGVLITGERTGVLESTGSSLRTVAAGDTALLDIGGRVGGYWSDCANTVVVGAPPSREQRRRLDAARTACEAAIECLRPGARTTEPVSAMRDALERAGFPLAHYAGHQLGTSVNEQPRLLPFVDEPVEAGMVFAIEAGVYDGAIGARCERIAVVTESGPDILSQFAWE